MKTTAEMIAVMQAYERGEKIETTKEECDSWTPCVPVWNWDRNDYRIALGPLECWVAYKGDSPVACSAIGSAMSLIKADRVLKMREVIE